jgi:1A family penicillin-binding protein
MANSDHQKLLPAKKKTHKGEESFPAFLKKYKSPIFYTTILIIAIILLMPLFTYLIFANDLKDKESILNRNQTGLTLLDRDQQPFFTFYQPKEIKYIPLSQTPTHLQEALISAEDKDFYTNPGFSIRGILRALIANISSGKVVQGGSTITQGLVKNQFLDQERTLIRKFQEVVLASEINRRYSKNDILELYLNSVYFGEGAFGIENAAKSYFGISSKDLSLAQSALLIGLLPAPSSLSPISNDPANAKKRQALVLKEMVEDKYITRAEADTAISQPLNYSPIADDLNTLAPHFAIYVKDQLVQKYGEENVIRRGMKVTTSLNSAWQQYAENTVANQVSRLSSNNTSNGAAVVIDPKTGQILVMVGSQDWDNESNGKTNMTIRPRQPGSSFKPFVYAAALEQRIITTATILSDKKTTFEGNYTPRNYDNKTRGPVTVRRALANSLNIPAVKIMQKIGVSDALSMAQRLGITTLGTDTSRYGLSLVLGSGEVPLIEMTSAFAVFANKGDYNQPTTIIRVVDKYGSTIDTWEPQSRNVLSAGVAFLISHILADNKARAETFGNALTISRPAAVKTGTTENYRDALTIGYTPSIVIGVWVGNNDNTPMDNIAGSLGAAPIWRLLIQEFLAGTPIERFTPPSTVTSLSACPYLGINDELATSSAITEYFLNGTQPSTSCASTTPNSTPTGQPTGSPTPTDGPSDPPTPTNMPTITTRPTNRPTPTIQTNPTLIPPPNLPNEDEKNEEENEDNTITLPLP